MTFAIILVSILSVLFLVGVMQPGFYRKQLKSFHKPALTKKTQKASASKELAVPEEEKAPPVFELYGHPGPPIQILAAALPQAPIGYGWEIHVVPNEDRNPVLRLAMLNLRTSAVQDEIEADLVIVRRWKYANDDTYAAFYRRAEQIAKTTITNHKYDDFARRHTPVYGKSPEKEKGKVMMANLITPMVDWATLITLRYITDNPDETKCNYMLIESPEKEPEAIFT